MSNDAMTPTKKTAGLSTVYLDAQRIGLMGDPKPMVAKIVAASGRVPSEVRVLRSRSPDGTGTPVQLEDIIDRTTEPTKPIYLTCKVRAPDEPRAGPAQYIAWPSLQATPPVRGPLPDQPAPPSRRPPPAPGGVDASFAEGPAGAD